jgi:hypothetical protein
VSSWDDPVFIQSLVFRSDDKPQPKEWRLMELATRLELVTCCFSAAGIGGLWPDGIVWRLA